MTGYKDAALLYWERGFAPIPVRNKRPVPAGATGRNGIVDEAKIQDWIANGFRWMDTETKEWHTQDSATANVALRAGLYEARIDVDDYLTKNGAAQLAELEAKLGPLPATPSSTARGKDSPSRQHFFALREPVTLVGKAAEDIEVVQFHHRYSLVAPSVNPDADNAPYLWYDADGELMDGPPHIDDLEYLPEAWIEYLMVVERDHAHSGEQWDGDIPDTASAAEERKLRAIVSSLRGLPEVWAPGAGWHDIVYRAACWLARIQRSNAYALTEDQAYQILLDHTPTYGREWGVDKVEEQWVSALKTTEGQFEEPPLEDRPPLLPWSGFPTDRAFPSVNGESFATLWVGLPENMSPAGLWGRRQQLLVAMLASGFTEQEAATVVWYSTAAKHPGFTFAGIAYPDSDSRLISEHDLWREVDKAKDEAARSTGATTEAAPLDERPSLQAEPTKLSFLTDHERAIVAGPDGVWWGSRVIDWARTTFGQVNESYYRANLWAVLSIIFAPKAMLPKKGDNHRPLNLYIFVLGPTTSGKSEAFRFIKNILKNYYLLADSPSIGGDHTPESLTKVLINRDGLSSFFYLDEAHTVISSKWKKIAGPWAGMPGMITALYDGEVEARYRATEEISGKGAIAYLTAHLMGTEEGMVDVIEPEDWTSGLVPRFIWAAVGQRLDVTEEMVTGGYVSESEMNAADSEATAKQASKMFAQWAAEFANASARVSRSDGKPSIMVIPDAVLKRFGQFAWALRGVARGNRRYADRLEPAFIRLSETVLRAASLVALSRGRLRLEMSDLLIAIHQAEEWATNAARMVEATDESVRTRRVNALEKTVLAHGGIITLAALHREYPNRKAEVEGFMAELIAQGRAEKITPPTGFESVRLKGIIDERSAA